MRSILKRASAVSHPESEPLKKIALDTEQDSPPHTAVNYGRSSVSGAHEQSSSARHTHDTIPSATTSTDQNTVMGDATKVVRTRPTQDV